MYSFVNISDRVRISARERNKSIGKLLEECGLHRNTLSNMKQGKEISSHSLAKIADKLGVSIDFLMFRTENPEINK